MKTAVFLDRDGVLNLPVLKGGQFHSPHHSDEFIILSAAKEPLRCLAQQGLILIIVTNQPNISRGTLQEDNLQTMHAQLVEALGGEKVIQDVLYCPHTADFNCLCRKPKPGMLHSAARKWGISLSDSFMIGDRDVDILAAEAAGCRSVILDYPYNPGVPCDYRATDIGDASGWILKQMEKR